MTLIDSSRTTPLRFAANLHGALMLRKPTEEAMKKSIVLLVLLASILLCTSAFAEGSHRVKGYSRDLDGDGYKEIHVAPHQSTNPDSSPRNNFNYPGNYNPNKETTTSGNPDRYLDRYNKEKRGW
jgi:hypothetical protein